VTTKVEAKEYALRLIYESVIDSQVRKMAASVQQVRCFLRMVI
jgi:hypothetical protein